MVKASPFSIRDTIQYILPVLVGAALFSPYFAPPEKLDFVFLAAALFSYVLHTPLILLARRVYATVPGLRTPVRRLQAEAEWWGQNWDYDRLFYQKLDEKEREYLYLTAGYADFHRLSSFFLLCFTLAQAGEVAATVARSAGPGNVLRHAWAVRTEMVGGWDVPALAAVAVGATLFWTSFHDYLGEAGDLVNTYKRFAGKYQESDLDLARGMWGWVMMKASPVARADVRFVSRRGAVISEARTDAEGRFRLVLPAQGPSSGYLTAEHRGHSGSAAVAGERALPQYTIELT